MKETKAPAERGFFLRILLDNMPLKLLSLLLSIALFSLVHSDTDAQRSIYVDVVALLPPPGAHKMLVSDLPTHVKITLRGSRSRISTLQRDDFAPIQMDLRDPTRRYFYFDASAIDIAGAARVVSIEPPAIELTWTESTERKVPVRVRLRGSPDDGFMVRRPVQATPPAISVRGPATQMDSIREVFTEDIAIDGLGAGAHDRRAQLEPLAGHATYVDAPRADVHLEIIPELGERILRRVDVAALGPGASTLRPNAVSIVLRGPVRALGEVEPDEIVPYVDTTVINLGGGVQSLEVKVRGTPDGFEVERVVPASVLAKRIK